jgi:hypothetical protein
MGFDEDILGSESTHNSWVPSGNYLNYLSLECFLFKGAYKYLSARLGETIKETIYVRHL